MIQINQLYQYIINKIRRVSPLVAPRASIQNNAITTPKSTPRSVSPVIPFYTGRIYQCRYSNWHHDPTPLLFILGSDAFYTHALNIHYLGALQGTLMRMILTLRASNQVITGYMLYRFLKARAYGLIKTSYRKYFTKYLLGRIVSPGISQLQEPTLMQYVAGNDFVKRLNKMLNPVRISKVHIRSEEVSKDLDEASIEADQARRGYL